MHGVTISEGDRMTLKRFKSDMASPVNSQLKCFIYFLIVAIFSFFLMFFLSPENKLYNIYHRKVTRPDIFGAAKDPETCTGRECVRGYVARHGRVMPEDQLVIAKVKEFPTSESLNATISDRVAIQALSARRKLKVTSNELLGEARAKATAKHSNNSDNFRNSTKQQGTGKLETNLSRSMKELPEVLLNDANSQNWWNAMLKRQIERKLHLRRMCETRYNQSVLPLTEFIKDNKRLHSFYYVDKFKLIYSFVHKVGSSNWARMLKTVTENNRLKRLYLLPTDEALWRLQNYTSFIIVRHPLVRLLSAYKDKFVEHHIPHFKSIGRQIMKRYRDGVTMEELQRADNVRFGEFLRYLVADKRNRGNTHWDNLIIRNRVCLFNYDIIAKLETGDDDTKFILKSFNLEGLVNLGSHYTNYTGKKDTLRSFYSKIPKSLLQSVIDAYESDFVLFNYSMNVP